MEEIRPPYLLLCNHNAFMDFMAATKAIFSSRANYVVAIDGFILRGEYKSEQYEIKIPVPDAYSVHIEYEYLGKFGDCVDLNTINDTLYVYPEECDFAVTKISLAAEELYSACKKK